MRQKTLSNWLKFILLGVGLCGLVIYLLVVPMLGQTVAAAEDGVFDHLYWPWLVFIWVTGLPCYAALAFGWIIASNIGKDRSFSVENARLLKWISGLAAGILSALIAPRRSDLIRHCHRLLHSLYPLPPFV